MTTVLQISDTHIVAPGQMVSGRLDTAASLAKLVQTIHHSQTQYGGVDALLISGDLSDDGSAESYEHFKSLMTPLDLPMFIIPGNHDSRAPMRQAFAHHTYLPQSDKMNWKMSAGDIDLIGLDTLIEGEKGGELDASTLAFLEQALKEGQSKPTLLALHHPPFCSGITFMDQIGLAGIDDLAQLLAQFDTDIRVVCGHIHSTVITTLGGKTALSAPSPNSCFAYDIRPDAPVGYHPKEDGFMLHRWQGGFQSFRVPIEAGAGPYPF